MRPEIVDLDADCPEGADRWFIAPGDMLRGRKVTSVLRDWSTGIVTLELRHG